MTLFLDSAFVDDARQAADLGFVVGLTTNPTLIGKALKSEPQPSIGRIKSREDLIAAICDVFPGTVMVQLTAETPKERKAEGERLVKLRQGQVGLKIPSTSENFPDCALFCCRRLSGGYDHHLQRRAGFPGL